MATQGTATVNFGPWPGVTDTTLVITGQSAIASTALVEAWLAPRATVNHSADEHLVDGPILLAGNITPAIGFTVAAQSRGLALYGLWSINWVYN